MCLQASVQGGHVLEVLAREERERGEREERESERERGERGREVREGREEEGEGEGEGEGGRGGIALVRARTDSHNAPVFFATWRQFAIALFQAALKFATSSGLDALHLRTCCGKLYSKIRASSAAITLCRRSLQVP